MAAQCATLPCNADPARQTNHRQPPRRAGGVRRASAHNAAARAAGSRRKAKTQLQAEFAQDTRKRRANSDHADGAGAGSPAAARGASATPATLRSAPVPAAASDTAAAPGHAAKKARNTAPGEKLVHKLEHAADKRRVECMSHAQKELWYTRLDELLPDGKDAREYIKKHQLEAIIWMHALHKEKLGCLLAEHTGVGKSFTTLLFCLHMIAEARRNDRGAARVKKRPAILFVPPTLLDEGHWQNECEKHFGLGVVKVAMLTDLTVAAEQWARIKGDTDIIIASEAAAKKHNATLAAKFREYNPCVLVMDEGSALKDAGSSAARLMTKAAHPNVMRLVLTATPFSQARSAGAASAKEDHAKVYMAKINGGDPWEMADFNDAGLKGYVDTLRAGRDLTAKDLADTPGFTGDASGVDLVVRTGARQVKDLLPTLCVETVEVTRLPGEPLLAAQARAAGQVVSSKERCVSGRALLACMDCGAIARGSAKKNLQKFERTAKVFAEAGAKIAGKKGAKRRDAITDFCGPDESVRLLAMTSGNSKGVNRLKDATNTIIFMDETHSDFTNRATCDQIIGRLRRLDPNPAFGHNVSIVFVRIKPAPKPKPALAPAPAGPPAPAAAAASAAASGRPGGIRAQVDEIKLALNIATPATQMVNVVAEANAMLGISGAGTIPQQIAEIFRRLGL